ncbi:hypothetical protein PT2222_90165 [Paraburkholderia tropica]
MTTRRAKAKKSEPARQRRHTDRHDAEHEIDEHEAAHRTHGARAVGPLLRLHGAADARKHREAHVTENQHHDDAQTRHRVQLPRGVTAAELHQQEAARQQDHDDGDAHPVEEAAEHRFDQRQAQLRRKIFQRRAQTEVREHHAADPHGHAQEMQKQRDFDRVTHA